MTNKTIRAPRHIIICIMIMFFSGSVEAQLLAFASRQNDNNCKLLYVVNPSDSIFYVAGPRQDELNNCLSFPRHIISNTTYRIDLSSNKDNYLLLLPRDTIAYKILLPSEDIDKTKELNLFIRISPIVIATNNDKKRNKQINRLKGWNANLNVIE